MCSEDFQQKQLDLLQKILDATRLTVSNRPQIDETYQVSDTQSNWYLDYKNRKHIYVWSPNALTFKLAPDQGTISMGANEWLDFSFRPGTQIFTSGQATLVPVYVRCTDETISNASSGSATVISGTVTANAGTNLNTSALALEAGGHLASIDTEIGSHLSNLDTHIPANLINTGMPTATAVSVGVTNTSVLSSNASRKLLILVNDSANPMYLDISGNAAVLNQGIRLNANGGYIVFDRYVPTAAIHAISSVATQNLLVEEG